MVRTISAIAFIVELAVVPCCEEALSLAHKYGLEHILDEQKPKRTLEFYWEQTKEKRDLKRHLKEMSAWQ